MPIRLTLPENVQPEIRDAFRQIEEALRQVDVPILRNMREVRGIPEGSSCYYVSATQAGVRKVTKINTQLYFEDLQKLESVR